MGSDSAGWAKKLLGLSYRRPDESDMISGAASLKVLVGMLTSGLRLDSDGHHGGFWLLCASGPSDRVARRSGPLVTAFLRWQVRTVLRGAAAADHPARRLAARHGVYPIPTFLVRRRCGPRSPGEPG